MGWIFCQIIQQYNTHTFPKSFLNHPKSSVFLPVCQFYCYKINKKTQVHCELTVPQEVMFMISFASELLYGTWRQHTNIRLSFVYCKMTITRPAVHGSDVNHSWWMIQFCFLPQEEMPTGCCSLWSPAGGRLRATIITKPWVVPTSRQGEGRLSVLRGKLSQKWKDEMASRDSRSMLVTLELRERVNELSLPSGQQSRHKRKRIETWLGWNDNSQEHSQSTVSVQTEESERSKLLMG